VSKSLSNFYVPKKWLIIGIILGTATLFILKPDFITLLLQPLRERLTFLLIAKNVIFSNFLLGIGVGQFVIEMQKYSEHILQTWQLQPVHNVFLLVLVELGLVGFSIFTFFLWKLFHMEQIGTKPEIRCSTWSAEGCDVYSKPPGTNVPRETIESRLNLQTIFRAVLIGFFVIALFDHYLWDIQQGQIMLWMGLGLLASSESIT
jgi:hypothetical protein